MQTTTTTTKNTLLARELMETRERLKELKKKEEELKTYFNELLDERESDDLLVNTAILISRMERTRTSYDTKSVDNYFKTNGINPANYKKTSFFTTLSLKAV